MAALKELQVRDLAGLKAVLLTKIPQTPDGPGCVPNCKWILEDLVQNGKLTGWPFDFNGQSDFPVKGKVIHLKLEGFDRFL